MSETTNNYQDTFTALDTELQQRLGHQLFTASYMNMSKNIGVRIYSSNNTDYPSGGHHATDEQNVWTETIAKQQTYIANAPEEFDAAHFTNLDELVAQGFGAVINIPVVMDNEVVGTLNLLDKTGAYADKQRIGQAYQAIKHQTITAYRQYLNSTAIADETA